MLLINHTARDFADAIKNLTPPGGAFNWPVGGFGDELLLATARELARVEAVDNDLLAFAIDQHRPVQNGVTIYHYRVAVNSALVNCIDDGLVTIEHLMPSAVIGSRIGMRLWSHERIFYLHVRYKTESIDFTELNDFLMSFKQAHVSLFFEQF